MATTTSTKCLRYGARIVRRSDNTSNCVKTDDIMLTTSRESEKCTFQICNLSKLYPPYHTAEELHRENLLIPLTKVSIFAKHFDVNQMYWTLFPFVAIEDEVQLRISCVYSDFPMTDFAIGLVPRIYRHSNEPFIASCPGAVFMSSVGFLECTTSGTRPISPLYVHHKTKSILEQLRRCSEKSSPDFAVRRSGSCYSFIANEIVLFVFEVTGTYCDYDVFVDMRCERVQGLWSNREPLVNVNRDDVLHHDTEENTISIKTEGNSTATKECMMLSRAIDVANKCLYRPDLVPKIIGNGVYNYIEGVPSGRARSPGRQHVLVTEFIRNATVAFMFSANKVWMWRCLTQELVMTMRLFVAARITHGDFYARNLLLKCDMKARTMTCTVIDFEKAAVVEDTRDLLFLNWCGLVGMVINLAYRNWKYDEVRDYIIALLSIVGHGIPLMFETPGCKTIVPNWAYIREWGVDTRYPDEHMDDYWHRKLQGTNVMVRKSAFANANKTFLIHVLMEMQELAATYGETETWV